jgi:hypothetical protein
MLSGSLMENLNHLPADIFDQFPDQYEYDLFSDDFGNPPYAVPPYTVLSSVIPSDTVSKRTIAPDLLSLALPQGGKIVEVQPEPKLAVSAMDHISLPQPDIISIPDTPTEAPVIRCDTKPQKISHQRGRKLSASNNAASFYKPLPRQPRSWGFEGPTEVGVFEYTSKGELPMDKTYSREQIAGFLRGPGKDRSKMVLWIQSPPAQHNHRYPLGPASAICRWDKCPVKRNTIHKGQWRVALDERADKTGVEYDPFHNAGYIHLYCLEVNFDLAEFFVTTGNDSPRVDLRPETRRFPYEERNPMALNREHSHLIELFDDWKAEQTKKLAEWRGPGPRQRTQRDLLYRQLTEAYIKFDTKGRSKARDQLQGFHIGRYLGDLVKYAQLKEQSRDIGHADSSSKRKWNEDGVEALPKKLKLGDKGTTSTPYIKQESHTVIDISSITPKPMSPIVNSESDLGGLQQILGYEGPVTRKRGHTMASLLAQLPSPRTGDLVKALPPHRKRIVRQFVNRLERRMSVALKRIASF